MSSGGLYVVSAQRPTAVTHVLTCNFTSPTERNLILAKGTRLEIHIISKDGLVPHLDVPIYGRIASLLSFRPGREQSDLIFVLTERYLYSILAYNATTGHIETRAHGDVHDRTGNPVDLGQIAIIDPDCRMIGLRLYNGMFKVIPIDSSGALKEPYNIRLEELTVLDIKFLHGYRNPTILVLYQDAKENTHLKTYDVSLKEKEFFEGPWLQNHVESGTSKIVPVRLPIGGALSIGEHHLTYHNGQSFRSISMEPTIIVCVGEIDATRYLLADQSGNLVSLVLDLDTENTVVDLKLSKLGITSIASCLSYLDHGIVLVGSSMGDSQLIKLRDEADGDGSFVEELDSFQNLGPIVDFCVIDLERQGQGQLVTCSGGFKDGSLKMIRNGVGIQEQAAIDLPNVKGIWALCNDNNIERHHTLLVVAFVGATRFLGINGEELQEIAVEGFTAEHQTLLCRNLGSDQLLQVTQISARLVSISQNRLLSEWVPEDGNQIIVVSATEDYIVLSSGGGRVFCLHVLDDKLVVASSVVLDHEISSLDVALANAQGEAYVAAGLWTDVTVRVLQLPSLQQRSVTQLGGDVVPRTLLFCDFEGVMYLLCALGDGSLFTFQFDSTQCALTHSKKVSLGTKPIVLRTFHSVTNGKASTHVFACSDRPTVIYSNNKKLLYSNVNLKEVNHICPLNCSSFPDSLAIASNDQLTIGAIDEIQKLHIRSIQLGEMPRRIVHVDQLRVCAVLTTQVLNDVDSDPNVPNERSFLRIFDDQTFDLLQSYELEPFEAGFSIHAIQFAEDPDQYIVVGTVYMYHSEDDPNSGRTLVFRFKNNQITLVASLKEKGCVYSLATLGDDKLVAAVNSRVVLYKWRENEHDQKDLELECSQHGFIIALVIRTVGSYVIVGDLMRSISVLRYKPVESQFELVARDFSPNWMMSVETLSDQLFIGTDNYFNIFSVRLNSEATTEEEKQRLVTVGEFHLGETVCQMRPGSLVMRMTDQADAPCSSTIFCTQNGGIGVIAKLSPRYFEFLQSLQINVNKVVRGVGGLKHEDWRSFHNLRKTVKAHGFIDGDIVETFLDLSPADMQKVCEGLREMPDEDGQASADLAHCSVDYVIKVVEELARLH